VAAASKRGRAGLILRDLRLRIPAPEGEADILAGIDLDLAPGERLGIVGESGSGKSMMALAIMGLLPAAAVASGSIRLDGVELLRLDDRAMCTVRGRRIAMIFQEPMTALNPVHPVGRQIAEGAIRHLGLSRRSASGLVRDMMARVGLDPARFSPSLYPHQLSGGQRQRVMIAAALACEPEILIADEPTTALDVTTQAQILRLIDEVVRERRMSLLLITHDLGVVAAVTDRMSVMYAGRIVESGETAGVFARMAHPYTRALLAARPREVELGRDQELVAIPGQVRSPFDRFPGCTFAPRCPRAAPACRAGEPVLRELEPGHRVACEFPA
jgi:peptide/nickel transport system ATP-binding protein